MSLKVGMALATVSLGACSSVAPFISHVSHPDRGWPIDSRSEWSLDIAGIELKRSVGQFEITSSLGYVITPGEPQPWVASLKVAYRIPLLSPR